MKRLILFRAGILLFTVSIVFSCCKKEEKTPPESVRRSIVLYISANNSLSGYVDNTLNDIKKGYLPGNGKYDDILMVFCHSKSENPSLRRYYKRSSGEVICETIMNYEKNFNSATIENFTKVLSDAEHAYPSEYHGLILWSHSSGWIPEGYYTKPTDLCGEKLKKFMSADDPYSSIVKSKNVKSFADDRGMEMDIRELANTLTKHYEFILFDCCLMGGIEVAYQFKDKCDYIIFSPTEILAEGFPYAIIMDYLFNLPPSENDLGLKKTCKAYFDMYDAKSELYRSATVSLIDCSQLEKLALVCSKLYPKYREKIATLNKDEIQRYFRGDHKWFYDFGDYIEHISTPAEYSEFVKAIDKAVIYKNNTDKFLDISIKKYSGLSTYIPYPESVNLNSYYKTLMWNKSSSAIE